MVDWLNLVESGYPITGMANSDSHNYGSGTGYPRTYLYVGDDDDLSKMSDKIVIDAIRDQRAVMSQGILAWPEVDGEFRMGNTQQVTINADGTVEVVLQIRAPSWVKVEGAMILESKEAVEGLCPSPEESFEFFSASHLYDLPITFTHGIYGT